MPLTNAQRQARHRAATVKVSNGLCNEIHCALISARHAAKAQGDLLQVAQSHGTEASLYDAEGKPVQARNARIMACYAWVALFESKGDLATASRELARARALEAAGQES